MNVVLSLFFGPIGLSGAVLKTSTVLLKYPTFEGFSFIFAWATHCASKRKKENHQFQKKISQITLSYPNMTISYQF